MRKSQGSGQLPESMSLLPCLAFPAGKLLHACKRAHIRVDSPNNSLLTMKNEMDYELLFGPLATKTFSSRTTTKTSRLSQKSDASIDESAKIVGMILL